MQSGERITINQQDYRIDTVLSSGAGSYGQVWGAIHATGRPVAIKLINVEAMTQADPALHGHWRAHLEREINFLRGLDADQSRHVVALLDHGEVDGQPALVLERLQANLGAWLAQRRREGAPPDLAQILDWAEQILEGLEVVHQAGFVYRDLKFSNLLVGEGGARLKLADFGSLKREDGDNTRSFIGTPATMAPEQVLPARRGTEGYEYAVDYRADYYALGLLLFALLTDQPTTAAQRRLGQLLALYGQEGAGQRDADLGGLSDEERELLRRSIEFWTIPARPERDSGIATLLVQLIDRLLARDPADRPADSLEIRATLDMARVAPLAAPTLTPDWSAPLPATEPPNRHPRRNDPPSPWLRRRWALLAGAVGLASVVAWAIIGPASEFKRDQAEPLSTVIAGPPAELAKPGEFNPTLPSSSSPPVSDAAPAPSAPIVASVEETAELPAATATPGTEAPEPPAPPAVSMAEAPQPPALPTPPVAEAPKPPAPPAASVAEAPEPPALPTTPVAEAPEPMDAASPPARIAPAKPRPTTKPALSAKPRAVITTPRPSTAPAAVEPRLLVHTKPAANSKPVRPAPAPAVAADRPAPAERSSVSPQTPVERAVIVDRPSSVTSAPAPRITKPVPPAAPEEAPQRPPVNAQAKPKRDSSSSRAVVQARAAPSVTSRPPAAPKPASKPASPARAEPPSRVASRPEPAPALPPIKLEARPQSAPALLPIKLESRPQPAPPAPPPIELVSRHSAATPTTRPSPVARVEPDSNSRTYSSAPPPARSTGSINQLRDEAGRAAAAVGDWASRTSTVVGKEMRRGLEAADQAVGRWAGRCSQADGCGRNTIQVERRDHWAERHGGNTVSQQPPPTRYDENDGFAPPPPRQYRDNYR